jgi:hypothetical protein
MPVHATWVLTRRAHQPPPPYAIRTGCCGEVSARLEVANLTAEVVAALVALPPADDGDGASPVNIVLRSCSSMVATFPVLKSLLSSILKLTLERRKESLPKGWRC